MNQSIIQNLGLPPFFISFGIFRNILFHCTVLVPCTLGTEGVPLLDVDLLAFGYLFLLLILSFELSWLSGEVSCLFPIVGHCLIGDVFGLVAHVSLYVVIVIIAFTVSISVGVVLSVFRGWVEACRFFQSSPVDWVLYCLYSRISGKSAGLSSCLDEVVSTVLEGLLYGPALRDRLPNILDCECP